MSAIETNGLTKAYGDVVAVDALDLTVESGEVFGFLGPNGAGKSTTIDVLLNYTFPTDGRAEVLGHDAVAETMAVRERVGVLPDDFDLYERLTGRRHLEFAIEAKGADDDPEALLERVGLDAAAADRAAGEYSRGMTQRLALAMALAGDPDLLILDEPSSGLDPNGIQRMQDIVREEADAGTTVFFSSHILGQVEAVCDRVGILVDGSLVAVDTIEGLREGADTGSVLRMETTAPPAVDLDSIEGVGDVSVEDTHVEVTCTERRAKARAVAAVENSEVSVLDLSVEETSLDDLFAMYTNGEGGDAKAGQGEAEAAPEEVVA